MAINSISINTIIGFLLKKKKKKIEIIKKIFQKQARIEEKLFYIRD